MRHIKRESQEIPNDEFIKAYDKYSDAIFRYCYYRVYEREEAKELVQEVYMRTWEYISKGNTIENMRAFFYKVAYHLIVDHSRKKKEISLDALHEKGFDAKVDLRPRWEHEIEMKAVLNIIQKLDDMYREAILLRYVDGFSPKEIATMLGESENVISVRIHRGIKQLRQLLKR